jgi:hypothetical protein
MISLCEQQTKSTVCALDHPRSGWCPLIGDESLIRLVVARGAIATAAVRLRSVGCEVRVRNRVDAGRGK